MTGLLGSFTYQVISNIDSYYWARIEQSNILGDKFMVCILAKNKYNAPPVYDLPVYLRMGAGGKYEITGVVNG